MKKCIIVLIPFILCALSQTVFAQSYNPVFTGAPFLLNAPDARGISLGNTGVATTADAASVYWNTSKLTFSPHRGGVEYSFIPQFLGVVTGISQHYLSGYFKIGASQALSSSLNFYTYGSLPHIDEQGTVYPQDRSANELSFDIGYSRKLSNYFSMGVTCRYIYSKPTGNIEGYSAAHAFATDITLYYERTLYNGDFAWGATLSNIGTKLNYNQSNAMFLPANLRIGGRRLFSIKNDHQLSFNLELSKLLVPSSFITNDNDTDKSSNDRSVIGSMIHSFYDAPGGFKEEMEEVIANIGIEYSYIGKFHLRIGYTYNSPQKGNLQQFTTGIGFKYNRFNLDIACAIPTSTSAYSTNLGLTFGYHF